MAKRCILSTFTKYQLHISSNLLVLLEDYFDSNLLLDLSAVPEITQYGNVDVIKSYCYSKLILNQWFPKLYQM